MPTVATPPDVPAKRTDGAFEVVVEGEESEGVYRPGSAVYKGVQRLESAETALCPNKARIRPDNKGAHFVAPATADSDGHSDASSSLSMSRRTGYVSLLESFFFLLKTFNATRLLHTYANFKRERSQLTDR